MRPAKKLAPEHRDGVCAPRAALCAKRVIEDECLGRATSTCRLRWDAAPNASYTEHRLSDESKARKAGVGMARRFPEQTANNWKPISGEAIEMDMIHVGDILLPNRAKLIDA